MSDNLCLRVYGELYLIDLTEVVYLQADDHYTHVYYASGMHFMVPFGLAKVEAAIDEIVVGEKFMLRLGRKYIVNMRRIFHVNASKSLLQLSDCNGNPISLQLPKPICYSLMQMLGDKDAGDT